MAISWVAEDVFLIAAVSSNFIPIQSSVSTKVDHNTAIDESGDIVLTDDSNAMTEASATYRWNAATGLGATFATIQVGDTYNDYLITSISVKTSNTGWPEVEIQGHKHAAGAHTNATKYTMPSGTRTLITGAFGAVDLMGNSISSDVQCTESSVTVTGNHVDITDENNDHFEGDTRGGSVAYSSSYNGAVANISGYGAGMLNIAASTQTSADGFDTCTVSGVVYLAAG